MRNDVLELDDDARELFSNTYQRLRSRLFAAALRIVRDPLLAEDMVHETFLRFCDKGKWQSYPAEALDAVVVTSCKHICIDWLRREDTKNRALVEYFLLLNFPHEFQDDDHDDIREALIKGMEELSDTERLLCKLRLSDQLSSQEIGQMLDLSPHAVDCRWHRIAMKLRAAMTKARRNCLILPACS